MIPDPNPIILYACISKGTTILANFSSGDPDLETLAPKCLENAPGFHRIYSHTIQKRIYIFLIEDPYVYFAVVAEEEDLSKSRGIEFLGRLKDAFVAWISKYRLINGSDSLVHGCFNNDFRAVFYRLLRPAEELDPPIRNPEPVFLEQPAGRSPSVDMAADGDVENRVADVRSGDGMSTERSLTLLQKGSGGNDGGRQQARRIWRKHVRVVLLIDFVVCWVLFAVWLSICKGFRCVER